MNDAPIPEPKHTQRRPGVLCLASEPPSSAPPDRGPAEVAEILLPGADAAAAEAAGSPAFATPLGREQGYVLDVSPRRAALYAYSGQGFQHGRATLRQLASRHGRGTVVPCGHIEDWPDVRLRAAADWLLNAELNLWGHERGDGPEATAARMKRKIDFAADFKINVIWFDGFGWNADRTPEYAQLAGSLSDYARRRHIRLAFGGYGGGYGMAYQRESIYRMPYYGRIFENRRGYPGGEPYDCLGMPRHPESRRHGTCLGNAGLAEQKLNELTDFVRRCRPGLLYIHELDAGRIDRARAGWQLRCADCRARWPSDEPASPEGAAGAYAHWFGRVVQAVNAVADAGSGYAASRDCEIVFVGPVYGDANDEDRTWDTVCEYFSVLSRVLGPAPNVQFGVREQTLSGAPPRPRVAMLGERLERVGHGHGVFVLPFAGGDTFFSDQLVAATPAMQRHWQGAAGIYMPSLGSVAEPVMLLNAHYGWNLNAAGAYPLCASREEAQALLRRCRAGVERPAALFGPGGLLHRACARLYGAAAASPMAELFSLGAGDGVFPLATGWRFAADAVIALEAGEDSGAKDHADHWRRRGDRTEAARDHVTEVLRRPLPDADVRGDVEWLTLRFDVSLRVCRVLSLAWAWRADGREESRSAAAAAAADLSRFLGTVPMAEPVDPCGGDLGVWRRLAARLTALAAEPNRP